MANYIKRSRCLFALACATAAHAAFGQITILDSSNTGWYDNTGFADPTNSDYVVGSTPFGGPWRDFFTFDASALGGVTVTGATLRVYNPTDGFSSFLPLETVSIFSFEGSLASLLDGTGGIAAYDDLGSGTLFGSRSVSVTDNNAWVQFTLNDDFLSFINNSNSPFALGGVLSTLGNDLTQSQYVFAFSDDGAPSPQLVLATGDQPPPAAPEPSTYGMIGAAFLTAIVALTRRRKNQITAT